MLSAPSLSRVRFRSLPKLATSRSIETLATSRSSELRALAGLVGLGLAVLAGCNKADDSATPVCVDTARSRALALGNQCLQLTSVRVRVSGTWKDLSLTAVTIKPLETASRVPAYGLSVETAGPAESFELVFQGVKAKAMLQQGYQSWSFAGATLIPMTVSKALDGALLAKAASTGDPLDEEIGVSFGSTLLGGVSATDTVAFGSTSSREASSAFAATRAEGDATLTVLYGASREALPVASGKVVMPTLVVSSSPDPHQALAVLAAETLNVVGRGRTPSRPPGGWYSWNELFEAVDETAVKAHIDIAATQLLPKGLPLVEIDDGWEVAWGDWRANAKFPSGMAGIAKLTTEKGLKAGVWLAPFLVDVNSETAKTADSGLFVRGADDKPLVHKPSGSAKGYFILDGTNPASMALATKPIAELASAGFTFFKLDFLYAGALPGKRKMLSTGHEALSMGLTELRKAMGERSIFNACGAPIFPLLGFADSMRIGSDTAFSGLSLNWPAIAFAARSTAARTFLSPLVWLDGDQTQARSPFTLAEAKASAYAAALAGPAYALGDDLRKLPKDRLALQLADEVLDLALGDEAGIALDPLEEPAEKIAKSPVLDAIAHAGETGAPPPTRWKKKGKSGTTYSLTFSWLETHEVTITR